MSSQNAPATPSGQTNTAPPSPPTGTWRHPRFEEISRRQNASRFTEQNVTRTVWNGTGLLMTYIAGPILSSLPLLHRVTTIESTAVSFALTVFRLILCLNIAMALYPLFRPKDNLADIPLTPTQRSLLGLNPDETPPLTPGGHYITPPRYAKSTSRLGTPGSRRSSYNNSPQTDSPASVKSLNSPFSPSSPTPLFQKALAAGSSDGSRRMSFGSTTPLNGSLLGGSMSIGALPAPPSPTSGKGVASVALNNRWLYERGRSSPGSKSILS